jgi:hypothetical protein
MKNEDKKISQRTNLKRNNRMAFVCNDEETKMLNRFFDKYHIQNKSKWLRETIVTAVLKQMEKDYPTLFRENEMK